MGTSVGSAEACQILAATVNSIMANESSSNTIPDVENEGLNSFNFQDLTFHNYSDQEEKISTNFLE
jgi:hypothetical protein